eukprot:CAMPEP_0182568164 /NCGR_PEP_ID=MMETSP1324-20130603/9189_1 /TAXON_ID=236786 /ORGANISM="Florenciella sp., Strain RCC1587" /LENGTH=50 /DNA_ID=CAMNT_0024782281 /DNA_START=42 /DNA_END=194 /DNA_ORIENTATION=-
MAPEARRGGETHTEPPVTGQTALRAAAGEMKREGNSSASRPGTSQGFDLA